MADKYLRKSLIPVATTETTIYTVPAANAAMLRSLRVTNTAAVSADITVTQYNVGVATANYLYKDQALSADATVDVFNGIPCILEEVNVLKVTSSQTGTTFYLSYLEVDRN
jgi:hypothetical protein